jgi:hypothetical protein
MFRYVLMVDENCCIGAYPRYLSRRSTFEISNGQCRVRSQWCPTWEVRDFTSATRVEFHTKVLSNANLIKGWQPHPGIGISDELDRPEMQVVRD